MEDEEAAEIVLRGIGAHSFEDCVDCPFNPSALDLQSDDVVVPFCLKCHNLGKAPSKRTREAYSRLGLWDENRDWHYVIVQQLLPLRPVPNDAVRLVRQLKLLYFFRNRRFTLKLLLDMMWAGLRAEGHHLEDIDQVKLHLRCSDTNVTIEKTEVTLNIALNVLTITGSVKL